MNSWSWSEVFDLRFRLGHLPAQHVDLAGEPTARGAGLSAARSLQGEVIVGDRIGDARGKLRSDDWIRP